MGGYTERFVFPLDVRYRSRWRLGSNFMNSEQIRGYCEEALDITGQQGVEDGLAFLIGRKFSRVYYQLKSAHNKLRFLYPDRDSTDPNHLPLGNRTLQLSYAITVNENYRATFEQIDRLEEVLEQFMAEIKSAFDLQDIQDYLNSYPRLGFKRGDLSDDSNFLEEEASMTAQDTFAEVEDILLVDEMKKLFS